MPNRRQRRLGRAADITRVEVTHRCGHRLLWDFYGNGRLDAPAMAIAMRAGVPSHTKSELASLMACPRCTGEAAGTGADIVFPATGVCHAHDGACGDSPHDRWLFESGARISRN